MVKDEKRREQILQLVGECFTDKEIAERLHVSRSTVANYYLPKIYREHGWFGAGAGYKLIRFVLTGKDGNA